MNTAPLNGPTLTDAVAAMLGGRVVDTFADGATPTPQQAGPPADPIATSLAAAVGVPYGDDIAADVVTGGPVPTVGIDQGVQNATPHRPVETFESSLRRAVGLPA